MSCLRRVGHCKVQPALVGERNPLRACSANDRAFGQRGKVKAIVLQQLRWLGGAMPSH